MDNQSREDNINLARVYLREAKLRAKNPSQKRFRLLLIQWAGNARMRAIDAKKSKQLDLFDA